MANLYIRGKTIWVFYNLDGQQNHISTKLKDTKKNRAIVLNKLAYLEDIIADNSSITQDFFKDKRQITSLSNVRTKFPSQMTFRQVFEEYITQFLKKKKNESLYENAMDSWEKFSEDRPITSLRANHFTYWQNEMKEKGYSHETIRTYSRYLRTILNYAIKIKLYHDLNPVVVPKSRQKKMITTIPEKHIKKVLKYLEKENEKLYKFIYFLYLTGLRVNEALQLTWKDIHFDKELISLITYKDQERPDLFPVNIDVNIVPFLKSFQKKEGKLFDLSIHYLLKPFQKALTKCKLPKYTLHDLRRTFASRYATKIERPIELQTLMRHKKIDTTLRYYVEIDILQIGKNLKHKTKK